MDKITENDILDFINDTSNIAANERITDISNGYSAYKGSIDYVKDVEFWKWMNKNYNKSGIFDGSKAIQDYILTSSGKANWMELQLQGKGYEWDFMMQQQGNIKNLLSRFDAGIDPTQAGIDITKTNLLNGKETTYQLKSYLIETKLGSKALKNTPKDAIVITQSENIASATNAGYTSKPYQNKDISKKITKDRFNNASKGLAKNSYSVKGVTTAMGRSALIGAAFAITVEGVAQHKRYKLGEISKREFVNELAKSGGNAATTAGITSGIMLGIEASIVTGGLAIPIAIPISIAIGAGVDYIVGPLFKKGNYEKQLKQMKFYEDIGQGYIEFIDECNKSFEHFEGYIKRIIKEEIRYRKIKEDEARVNLKLIDAFNRI